MACFKGSKKSTFKVQVVHEVEDVVMAPVADEL